MFKSKLFWRHGPWRVHAAAVALCALMAIGGAANAKDIVWFNPHVGKRVITPDKSSVPVGPPNQVVEENGLRFNVYYEDLIFNTGQGFAGPQGAGARARMADAMRTVARTLNQPGELDVLFEASLNDSNEGFLASAGTFYSFDPGFQGGSARTRLLTGVKPFPNTVEIISVFNFGFNYNVSENPPAFNQIDLQSVALHELTHGLGVTSLSDEDGSSRVANNVYAVWDELMRRNDGDVTLFAGDPPSFLGAASDLVSGDLVFDGPAATGGFGQAARPPIYAPSPFSEGSSLSHWSQGIPGAAVMRPMIPFGAVLREFRPVEIGAFVDLGYLDAAEPQEELVAVIVGPAKIEVGQRLVLQLFTSGFPGALEIEWRKDGVVLDNETGLSLVVDAALEDDAGVYRALVSSAVKTGVLTPPFTVQVLPPDSLPLGAPALLLGGGALALAGAAALRRRRGAR